MAKKDIKNQESEPVPQTDEMLNETNQPIRRLSEFTEEKIHRVSEEMLTDPAIFDGEVIIIGFEQLVGGTTPFYDVKVQGNNPVDVRHVITNSPSVANKLWKVKLFPVLAKFTRREVRGKFKYDLE